VLAVAEGAVASAGSGSRQRASRMAGVELPAADRAQARSDRFDLSVGWRRPVNLVIRAAGPHLSFIARRDGGPPARKELGRPRSGRRGEAARSGPLGSDGPGRSKLTICTETYHGSECREWSSLFRP
jgi:hypothetical protein